MKAVLFRAAPFRRNVSEFVSVYVTVPSMAKAHEIANLVVGSRLAACANMLEGTSVYRWEGAVLAEAEVVMFLKTTRARLAALIAAVKANHPYEVPCIVALPIENGHAPYLDWIRASTEE